MSPIAKARWQRWSEARKISSASRACFVTAARELLGQKVTGYMGIFLFESEMFHCNADNSRQKLVLPEGLQKESLYRVLRREVGKILTDKIPKITEKNRKVKEKIPASLGLL